MKRILALLMALIMVFAFAACTSEEPSGSNDSTPPANEENNANNENNQPLEPTGLNIGEAMIKQMLEAKSVCMEMNMALDFESQTWHAAYEDASPTLYNEKGDATIKIVETMVKTESGVPNFKLEMNARFSDGEGGYDEENQTVYLVDGYMYVYDSYYGKYVKERIYSEEVITMMNSFTELFTNFGLTQDEKNWIYEKYGEMMLSFFDLNDLKGTFSFDLKAAYEDALNYIKDLDPATMTFKDLMNLSLSSVDPELTVDELLGAIEDIAGMKPMEFYDVLDAAFKEKCGYTIQGIYDKVINDQRIFDFFVDVAELSGSALPEGFTEMWETLKTYKIRDFVAEFVNAYGFADVTMYEIVQSLSPEAPSLQDLLDSVSAILNLSLTEVEQTIGRPVFTDAIAMIKEYTSYITLSAADMKYEMGLSNVFAIESFAGTINFGFTYKVPSSVTGKTDSITVNETGTMSASYSNDAIVITPPSADQIYEPSMDHVGGIGSAENFN